MKYTTTDYEVIEEGEYPAVFTGHEEKTTEYGDAVDLVTGEIPEDVPDETVAEAAERTESEAEASGQRELPHMPTHCVLYDYRVQVTTTTKVMLQAADESLAVVAGVKEIDAGTGVVVKRTVAVALIRPK